MSKSDIHKERKNIREGKVKVKSFFLFLIDIIDTVYWVIIAYG